MQRQMQKIKENLIDFLIKKFEIIILDLQTQLVNNL